MEVTGKLVKVLEKQTGTSKAGKEWQKQSFVIDTGEQYNNIACFELFGDKINLLKAKTGDNITVSFNINCNEWQDKYYTSLQAWKIDNVNDVESKAKTENFNEQESDLPF